MQTDWGLKADILGRKNGRIGEIKLWGAIKIFNITQYIVMTFSQLKIESVNIFIFTGLKVQLSELWRTIFLANKQGECLLCGFTRLAYRHRGYNKMNLTLLI